jgi:hypothetical protein
MHDRDVTPPLRREVETPRPPPSVRLMLVVPATMMLAMATLMTSIVVARGVAPSPARTPAAKVSRAEPGTPTGDRRSDLLREANARVRIAVEARLPAFAECMSESHARNPGTRAMVTVFAVFDERGRAAAVAPTGVEASITPACLNPAIGGMKLPPTGERVGAEIDVMYAEGRTRVSSRVLWIR